MVENKGVTHDLEGSPTQVTSVFGMMWHAERIDKTVIERLKHEWQYNDPTISPDGKKEAYFVGTILIAYKQ